MEVGEGGGRTGGGGVCDVTEVEEAKKKNTHQSAVVRSCALRVAATSRRERWCGRGWVGWGWQGWSKMRAGKMVRVDTRGGWYSCVRVKFFHTP